MIQSQNRKEALVGAYVRKKESRYRPVNWKIRKEFGDFLCKITELIDAVGAKVSTRGGRGFKEEQLCLSYIFNMHCPQPEILLRVFWSLQQLLHYCTTSIQSRLQQLAKTCRRIYCYNIDVVFLCKIPCSFFSQCFRHRVPFLSHQQTRIYLLINMRKWTLEMPSHPLRAKLLMCPPLMWCIRVNLESRLS